MSSVRSAIIAPLGAAVIGHGGEARPAGQDRSRFVSVAAALAQTVHSPVPTLFLMIILRATLSLFQTILIARFATIDL